MIRTASASATLLLSLCASGVAPAASPPVSDTPRDTCGARAETSAGYAYGLLGAYADQGLQLTIMASPPRPEGDEVRTEMLLVLRPRLWAEGLPRNVRVDFATMPVSFSCSRRTERRFPGVTWGTDKRPYPVTGKPEGSEWGAEVPVKAPASGVDLFAYEVYRFACGERSADQTFTTLEEAVRYAGLPTKNPAPPPQPLPE